MEHIGDKIWQKDFDQFVIEFGFVQLNAWSIARNHGFWDKPREDGTLIALMHSELSEALEALRHDDPPDDKIPEFSSVEAELADCVIRIMDFAEAKNMRLARAIVAKLHYNEGREYKHGKEF